MLEERVHGRGPRRLTTPAGVDRDGHERRPALSDELVEAHRQRVEEVARSREAGADEVAAVVVCLRVRDDEKRSCGGAHVVGKVVARAVGVVDEAALLDEQLPRVRARPGAAVPTEWTLAEDTLEGRDRAEDLLPLLVAREPPGLDPASTVSEQVVVTLAHPLRDAGVELERSGGRRDGDGNLRCVEDAREPPDAGAAAVVVVRLGAEIQVRRIDAGRGVFSPAVVAVVAPPDRVLGAFLVDEHDVDDDVGAFGPGEPFWLACVADEIAFAHPLGDHRGDYTTVTIHVDPDRLRNEFDALAAIGATADGG